VKIKAINEQRVLRTAYLPLKFLEETCALAYEDEMALANKNMRKQAGVEERKARTALGDLTNVVDGGVAVSSITA